VIAEHQAAAAVVVLEQRQSVGGGHRVRLGSAEAAPDPLKKTQKTVQLLKTNHDIFISLKYKQQCPTFVLLLNTTSYEPHGHISHFDDQFNMRFFCCFQRDEAESNVFLFNCYQVDVSVYK